MKAVNRRFSGLSVVQPLAFLCLFTLCCPNSAPAIDACSEPTGSLNIAMVPGSDMYLSIPFTRAPVYCGTVQSTAGSNCITVQGAPGWIDGQWQNGSNYVVFTSSSKEGAVYEITNNSSDTLMVRTGDLDVDFGCEDLTGVSTGDQLAIIPFWTLGTAFPGGEGITPSLNTSASGRRTQLLFLDAHEGSGIYRIPQIFYFYNFWRRSYPTTPSSSNFNDVVIYPDRHFIARQPTNVTTVTFVPSGTVVQYATRTCLFQQRAFTFGQLGFSGDNYVANYHSTTQTLNQSNLASASTASNPNANPPTINDLLFVYDNSYAVFNKTPSHIYFYDVDHWADLNNPPYSVDRGGDPVFAPGNGVTIRKKTNSTSSVWSNPP
jgi:uncharacterized protein (TIGR02597 family)